jgi:hypothetical protein
VPRRRREANRGAEHSAENPARLPDARPIRRSPQCILRTENALNEATNYLYGCSFEQFRDAVYKYAYDHGHLVGYLKGHAAGRRKAKGLPEARSKRGRPPAIDPGLSSYLVSVVEKRKPGESVKDAVRSFLGVMRAGLQRAGEPQALKLPTFQEAIRSYHRKRKKPKNSLS